MATLRLKGLVGAMNRVREQLAAGIPTEQADAFRENVRRTVADVEKICAANDITPAQLSAPSRSAYLFLKNLDLDHLPILQLGGQERATTFRVKNLVRIESGAQRELERLADTTSFVGLGQAQNVQTRAALRARIQSSVVSVEKIARAESGSPARLPTQSRQVYEWLTFLSAPENLDAHIETLRIVLEESKQFALTQRIPNSPRVRFEFAQRNGLFRIKRTPQEIQVTASEGFISAPREVLQALVQLAHRGEDAASIARLREYARGDEFGEILLTLSLPTMELETNTRGRHFDLRDIFGRVNDKYFAGRINAPRLVWNRTITFRKMGHYVANTDTIMLSITLDDARVPRAVIDLVMYHELLHKVMGIQTINGRRYAHTPAFRQAERRFNGYAETEAWLNEWVKQFQESEIGLK